MATLFLFGVLLFFIAVTALVVVLVVVGVRRARARREQIAQYAAHREWGYARSDPSLAQRFQGAPFGHGSGRSATNVVHGTHEARSMVAFDYAYTTSSGTGDDHSSTTHRFSVVALNIGVTAPDLSVAPAGTFSRLINKLTKSDILVGHEAFDHAFTVKCSVPEFARDVLHHQMAEMLMRWPDLAWRFDRDSLLSISQGQHRVEEIDHRLQVLDAILRQVPPHVWQRLGAAPQS